MLNIGDKVKYLDPNDLYKKNIKEGIVHGVKTKEVTDEYGHSTVVDRTYLIDTGETVHETAGYNNDTGEVETVRQPEQIEMRIKQ